MDEIGESRRVIGHYVGAEPGPLVVAIGGIHGNEPAGIAALERLFELLEEEPRINPGFTFRGELLALRGNLAALAVGRRFIDVDLNRIWRPLRRAPGEGFANVEERELDGLLAAIEHASADAPLSEIVLLDLHTTTAAGGVFAITGDDAPSLSLAAELGVPVIKGMLSGLQGSTLHYFRSADFGGDRRVRAMTFEAGWHGDPASADRALAATVNLLRAMGCVREEDVSTLHDETLRAAGRGLPVLTELAYVHKLAPDGSDGFVMRPGYANFSPVERGEVVARDRRGDIAAPCTGYLLMPLYQQQGGEGFFIVTAYRAPLSY